MIREIYLRNIEDPNYQEGILEHSNDVESIIQQIRMILGTDYGQVLGDCNFGVSLKKLVFQTKIPKQKIEQLIQEQINDYVNTKNYSVTTKVSFGKSSLSSDYAIVDIIINQKAVLGIIVE